MTIKASKINQTVRKSGNKNSKTFKEMYLSFLGGNEHYCLELFGIIGGPLDM
jgi:hypothetical protein